MTSGASPGVLGATMRIGRLGYASAAAAPATTSADTPPAASAHSAASVSQRTNFRIVFFAVNCALCTDYCFDLRRRNPDGLGRRNQISIRLVVDDDPIRHTLHTRHALDLTGQ